MRGLAALYVVVFHISQLCQKYADAGPMSRTAGRLLVWGHFLLLGYGRYAVAVFIVLSGYCLMLPLAQSGQSELPGGLWRFMKRRAWRILPPYYAAMVVSLAVILLVPGMGLRNGLYWDAALPAITPGVIASHMLLVHSLGPWALRIDPPMWSVAVEWQIYFLFPLVLLPLRKRIGSFGAAIACVAMGIGCSALLNHWIDAPFSCGWFLGLFALGAWAATVGFSPLASAARWRNRVPWGALALILTLIVMSLTIAQRKSWEHVSAIRYLRYSAWGSEWPMDLFIGLAASCLIIHLTGKATQSDSLRRSRLLAFFEMPALTTLGAFSYSLYLIHAPLLSLMELAGQGLGLSPAMLCAMEFAVALPAAIGVSYLFHTVFELPFMGTGKRAVRARSGQPVHDDALAGLAMEA
jgi:peptidoglycan/LPS O-acetylase OafA/YrhL